MTLLARNHDDVLERVAPDLVRPLDEVKRQHVERAMILCRGNIVLAARKLRVSRSGLLKMLAQWKREDA